MSSREERIAKNETTAREINEQLEDAHEGESSSRNVRAVCECGHSTCERVVAITPDEYADVRGDSRRFVVVRDHVIADVEEIVAETDRFVVVVKRQGTPAAVATQEDGPG